MLNSKPLNSFRYFLECYFNISTNYVDLPQLTSDFKESEANQKKEELIRELQFLKSLGDWEFLQKFVREYGMRELSIAQLKEMLDILIQVLSDP